MLPVFNKKVLFAGTIGNIIEFYDFTLYGFFAPLIAQFFFPSSDPRTAIFLTLAIFSAGFLMRPLGGVIFGHIGDKFGRKVALSSSILLMSFATALMGFLPSYDRIGIWASIALMVCRILQGISTGGEYSGAFILLIEHSNEQRKGFAGSLIASSCALGALLAALTSTLTLKVNIPWAWRVPFVIGSLLGFLGLYIRTQIDESPEFLAYFRKQSPLNMPIFDVFKKAKGAFFKTIAVTAFSLTLINILIVFVNVYLNKTLLIPLDQVMSINTLSLVIFVIAAPVAGLLSDKAGHIYLSKIIIAASLVLIYPIFLLLNTHMLFSIFLGETLLSILAASLAGILNAFMYSQFPLASRYSGVAFSHGIGSSIGSVAPLIASWLIVSTGNTMTPAIYVMGCALIAFGSFRFKNKFVQ